MATIAEASSLFEIDMELDSLLEQMEEQVEAWRRSFGRSRGQVPPVLRGARRESGPDRAIRTDDGGPRAVLPERGCAVE